VKTSLLKFINAVSHDLIKPNSFLLKATLISLLALFEILKSIVHGHTSCQTSENIDPIVPLIGDLIISLL
jgi:hypothetical protein